MITFILLIVSALLTALSTVFSELAFLCWVSITPLIYLSVKGVREGIRLRRAYLYGFVWFLTYYLVIYHWFAYLYPMDFLGVTPTESIGVVAICWIGLSLFQAVGSALVPLIFRAVSAKKLLIPFTFASIWVLYEYAQSLTWAGVPWARLALSQVAILPAVQSASLFGSLFVSFIIVTVNAFLALAFTAFKEKGISHLSVRTYAIIALAIFGSNLIFGGIKLMLDKDNKENEFTVALIQGNISSSDKWAASGIDALDLYVEMTYEASEKEKLDVVLWPETVINFNLLDYGKYRERVCTLASDTGAVIYVGTFVSTYTENEQGEEEEHEYNAIVAFFPDGSIEESPYYKRHLVPFGEYLPMRSFFETFIPPLASLNLMGEDLSFGDDSYVSYTEHGAFGRLVCFDSIYPELARDSVRDGAQAILLSTNDSWYMDSAAVYQHNNHAALRAVENGRWVLRAANTGISSVISSSGKTVEYLEPLTTGYVIEKAYTNTHRTLYSYVGDLIVLICFALVSYELVTKATGRIKKRNTDKHG